MRTIILAIALFSLTLAWAVHADEGYVIAPDIRAYPVSHATLVIRSGPATIYVDPVGDPSRFRSFPGPDLILITDIHRDHLDTSVIDQIKHPGTRVIATAEAVSQLGFGTPLSNGDTLTHKGIGIEAVPAYNLTEERLKFHPKGRGNGYIITADKKRIYLSGDTEDIPEMKRLKAIDCAFICMNLPYTMTETQAAEAVLEFRPAVAIPYHYRGKNGFSDVQAFKETVEKKGYTRVELLNWY